MDSPTSTPKALCVFAPDGSPIPESFTVVREPRSKGITAMELARGTAVAAAILQVFPLQDCPDDHEAVLLGMGYEILEATVLRIGEFGCPTMVGRPVPGDLPPALQNLWDRLNPEGFTHVEAGIVWDVSSSTAESMLKGMPAHVVRAGGSRARNRWRFRIRKEEG